MKGASFKQYLKSQKFLLFLLLIIFGIVPGFILRACVITSYEHAAILQRSDAVIRQLEVFSARLTQDGLFPEIDPFDEMISDEMEEIGASDDAQVLLVDSDYRILKASYQTTETEYIPDDETIRAFMGENVTETDVNADVFSIAVPVWNAEGDRTLGIILFSAPADFVRGDIWRLKRMITLFQIVVAVAVILIGFILSGKLTRPFKRLTRSIQDVQEGYQSHFEPVETFTETSQLSEACSDMLGRLKRLDDSREEFVSNVSHELKTPLTSMKVLSDSLLSQENVPNEIYRDFMKDIAGEIDRENSIINDLLSLVTLNRESGELNIQEVSINDMLDLLMKRLRPIAEQKQVELLLESFRPVTAEVDEVKLTLAVSNLIENAIKYNRPEGYVHVTLNADHENFFINVIDNGIGIPEEAQEHIFERFYRVDKSHSRKIGGTGLGLAITHSIVGLHHGAIRVHSVEGEGTTFTLRIPLEYYSE